MACDRSRAWISLRLDDELSKFEHLLLGAHLAVCRDCRRFAADVDWQTQSIRGVRLEPLTRPITIPSTRSWRRPAIGVSTAAVAASIAALAIGLRGPSTQRPVPPPHLSQAAGEVHRGGPAVADQSDVNTFRGESNAT